MKSTEFDPAQVARWFHAVSDETRVAVLQLLANGERCVCDLQVALEAAQSRLSFHLKVLKEAGLVADRKEGRWSYYTVKPEALDAMAEFIAGVRPQNPRWGDKDGCC